MYYTKYIPSGEVVGEVVVKAQFTHPTEVMSGGARNAFFTLGFFRKGREGQDVFSLRGPLLRRA